MYRILFVCLPMFLSCDFLFLSICPTEKAKYIIFQPNLSFTYFFLRSLNNNFSACVIFVLLLYSSFVHHKSLRYELNHLIAIIRLSQLVIGIDGRARAYFHLSLRMCAHISVLLFLCFSFYLFKKKKK